MPLAQPHRALLVLGMHRGGTSALSRVASLLGAAGPAHPIPPGPDNPRGFWEPQSVVRLNDEMLLLGRSHWAHWTRFDPGRLPPAMQDTLRPRMAAALRAEYGDAGLFVLKDPRMSRMLPLWLPLLTPPALSATPCALLALRHPAAVCASLASRNGFPARLSLLLWLRHMLDAEQGTRGLARAIVSYDALLQDWRIAMNRAGARLGLDWPTGLDAAAHAIDAFLDPALRHVPPNGPPGAVPNTIPAESAYAEVWTRHAWTALQALETDGETPAALDTLDRVRAQFDDACRLFAPTPTRSPVRPDLRPDLGQVTLCAADSRYVPLTALALRSCAAACRFGDAVLFTDAASARPEQAPEPGPFRIYPIAPLASRDAYSAFVLRGLAGMVTTSHALVVQWDGWVSDAAAWDPAFLEWDYIGAPWPRPDAAAGEVDVGNGGFSLRSRRLLDALAGPDFAPVPGIAEDVLICRTWRRTLEREHGIRFAPAAVATRFAYERVPPAGPTFGFHGLFNAWRHLDDAGLAELVALLPGPALHGREFAELAALCFLRGRHAALPGMGDRWSAEQDAGLIARALQSVLRTDGLVRDCLRQMGLE